MSGEVKAIGRLNKVGSDGYALDAYENGLFVVKAIKAEVETIVAFFVREDDARAFMAMSRACAVWWK